MANKLFSRKRDGRVEVRLNDAGRATVQEFFVRVVAAERDTEHAWHHSMRSPINPSSDEDDPVATLARQRDVASNAELALMTVHEEFLNDAEAWAWLTTLQVALRATAVANGLLSDEKLESCPADLLHDIRLVQQLLFDLAACF